MKNIPFLIGAAYRNFANHQLTLPMPIQFHVTLPMKTRGKCQLPSAAPQVSRWRYHITRSKVQHLTMRISTNRQCALLRRQLTHKLFLF